MPALVTPASAPGNGLVPCNSQNAAHAEAAGCSPSPTGPWAATSPGMETTLTAMLFSSGPAALAHAGDYARSGSAAASSTRAPRTTQSAKPRRDSGLLAPVLARHLDGRPDRSADMGLQDLQVGDR
jgi:hypothetical protein